MERIFLGKGILTWNKGERVTDRYGSIFLMDGNSLGETIGSKPEFDENIANLMMGSRGRLVAKVVETRKSTHIGDRFRKVFPETPNVGEEIVLCEVGTFFIEGDNGKNSTPNMGIKPSDNREKNWMYIKKLYRAHEQTVILYFDKKSSSKNVH